jgi:hypothetical protein
MRARPEVFACSDDRVQNGVCRVVLGHVLIAEKPCGMAFRLVEDAHEDVRAGRIPTQVLCTEDCALQIAILITSSASAIPQYG